MSSLSSSSSVSSTTSVKQQQQHSPVVPVASSSTTTASVEEDNHVAELNEIPIYVRGEQRWISGITNDTTCAQLIDALLRDEGILIDCNGKIAHASPITTNNNSDSNTKHAHATKINPNVQNQYVITERWKRVEQILDGKTKIWKIWTEWGVNQSEVIFFFFFGIKLHSFVLIAYLMRKIFEISFI